MGYMPQEFLRVRASITPEPPVNPDPQPGQPGHPKPDPQPPIPPPPSIDDPVPPGSNPEPIYTPPSEQRAATAGGRRVRSYFVG